MYALTLQQPWATAVAHFGKDIENRCWKPPERAIGTRIAIHAGLRSQPDSCALLVEHGFTLPHKLPAGVIVCTAVLRGWVFDRQHSDSLNARAAAVAVASRWYEDGSYGWVLAAVQVLPHPMPAKGSQGLWHAPTQLVELYR